MNRLLTIRIRKYLVTQPTTKRSKKAVRYIREKVAHYTQSVIDNVKIDKKLNSAIVKRYSKSMKPVKMNLDITGGKVIANEFPEIAKASEKKEAPKTEKPTTNELAKKQIDNALVK